MPLKLEDNVLKVVGAINQVVYSWLEESAGELEAQVKRNSAVNTGETKSHWSHMTNADEDVAVVGNTMMNAIWEEFGTGEYSEDDDGSPNDKGRKGGWWIPVGDGEGMISPSVVAKYHFRTSTNKFGQTFAFTYGKHAKHAFWNAKEELEPKIQQALRDKMRREFH